MAASVAIHVFLGQKEFDRNYAIIYLANPSARPTMAARDRPVNKKPAYLAGFLGFFFSAFLCGSGGVASIRRNTSSALGGFCFLSGLLMDES